MNKLCKHSRNSSFEIHSFPITPPNQIVILVEIVVKISFCQPARCFDMSFLTGPESSEIHHLQASQLVRLILAPSR